MTCLPSILATGAAAVGLMTSAMVFAQVGRVDPSEVLRDRARLGALRAEQQRRRNLANQLGPFYRYELMHARTACGLSREELRRIRPDADAAYKEAIARLDEASIEARQSLSGVEPDYQEAIREAVLTTLEGRVTPQRRAALVADVRLQREARKQAGVDMLVAVLDRDLLLTGPQRRQIAGALSARWDDRWSDAIELAIGGSNVIPKVPEHLVTPYLSDAQCETWHHLSRFQGRLWGVSIDHGGDPAMDEDLGAAPKANRPSARLGLPRLPVDGEMRRGFTGND